MVSLIIESVRPPVAASPGRRRAWTEARLALEKMLTYASHAGRIPSRSAAPESRGNFPVALTHLALISAAFNLDRALGA